MGFMSKGLKNEFETSVVNQPSVFEPLKFYSTVTLGYVYRMVIILADYERVRNILLIFVIIRLIISADERRHSFTS